VYVLRLKLEQLGQRFRHGLKAATEVEPHSVPRRRRRDNHVGVTGAAGDLIKLFGQTGADTRRAQRSGDMEEGQLRDPGPKVGHDDAYADQTSAGERTERDTTGLDVVCDRVHLGTNGVFAVTVRIPGRRGPGAVSRYELSAVLVVEHVDVFCTVDLAEARQIGPIQLSEFDYGPHIRGRRSVTTHEPAIPGSVNVTFNAFSVTWMIVSGLALPPPGYAVTASESDVYEGSGTGRSGHLTLACVSDPRSSGPA